MKKLSQYGAKELLALLKRGNADAFTEIYGRYWKKLLVIALNRVKDAEAAEDIVQDAFAALWAGRRRLQIHALENYLATAVKYLALARLKKINRETMPGAGFEDRPSQAPSPEDTLHCKRILETVSREVNQLPDRCRLIFKYSRNENMPVKQIAEKLSISPKTVENQLTKALKIIKAAAKTLFISALPAIAWLFTRP